MDHSSRAYEKRGVSSSKSEVHAAIASLEKGLYPHAFCKVLPDHLGNDAAYATVLHADGAGTKSSLAYVYWRETGDLSVWRGIAQDAIVMNLDDLLCVGVCAQPVLFSSLIGRNKRLIPAGVITALIEGSEAFLSHLRALGISAHLGGGETADVGDLVRSVVVDSTSVARMPRAAILSNHAIRPGDVVVGLASFGRATYEATYNSGIGSNGLTLARHLLLHKKYSTLYPESFCGDAPEKALYYAGPYCVEDTPDMADEMGLSVGQLLLAPTRTYAPIFKEIFPQHSKSIHGMVHCTGGGQSKVLHFLERTHVIKDQLFAPPPLFELIRKVGQVSWREMYEVFNMGHLLEVYTDAPTAAAILQTAARYQVAAQIVGRVEASSVPKVSLCSQRFGEITYEKEG